MIAKQINSQWRFVVQLSKSLLNYVLINFTVQIYPKYKKETRSF